ncbi:condensation domain-containing protein, partial [Dokdonia pacifica]|uniref:condensation domain-containing protein n=1 Tax=Dokdonia pacifica TaxID=1627892 RepID=UPI001E297355
GSQMRLKVLDLGGDAYEFIWSFHHILMDGWCISVLINDFYQILNGLHKDETVVLPTPVKYSNYIEWLSKLDKEDSVSYWRDYLSSYTEKSSVPFKLQDAATTEVDLTRETLKISDRLFTQVTSLCNRVGVTQNIFIQAVWGYLLSRYNNTNDVVFGTVVSGRPGDLHGVEGMVGLFINT